MMLQNKTALVTGSTSGIGLAVAQELAKAGANLMLNGFGDVESARKLVAAHGGKVDYHGADLTKPEEIEDLIRYTEKQFGGVDILVNNAGIQFVAPVEEFPVEKWDAVIALNLSSSFHTVRMALPGMKKRDWGRIINIASVHGLVASTQKVAYVTAKHGLVGMTKVIALETANTKITCNAICPGWVHTPLVQKQIDDRAVKGNISVEKAQHDLLTEKQPSGKFVTPQQIGQLCVFLCSDTAQEIRGAALPIDGAWSAQ
jgi:3-hydroxybutyrate dehydrogenase